MAHTRPTVMPLIDPRPHAYSSAPKGTVSCTSYGDPARRSLKAHDAPAGLRHKRRNDLPQELDSLRANKRHAPLQSHEIQASAYLLARLVDDRPVDNADDQRRLKECNQSVQNTRARMSHGRGNIDTELTQTGDESYYRTLISRRLSEIGQDQHALQKNPFQKALVPTCLMEWQALCAASAIAMEAGNCGENTALALHLHANQLKNQESLAIVSNMDHSWVKLETPKRPTVFMDAWAEGPAMLAEDTRFTPVSTDYVVTRQNATQAQAKMLQTVSALYSDPWQHHISQQLSKERTEKPAPPECEKAIPLVSAAFAQRAGDALHALPTLSGEVLAVHVARTSVNAGIRTAARSATEIVRIAGALDTIKREPLPDYPPPLRRPRR